MSHARHASATDPSESEPYTLIVHVSPDLGAHAALHAPAGRLRRGDPSQVHARPHRSSPARWHPPRGPHRCHRAARPRPTPRAGCVLATACRSSLRSSLAAERARAGARRGLRGRCAQETLLEWWPCRCRTAQAATRTPRTRWRPAHSLDGDNWRACPCSRHRARSAVGGHLWHCVRRHRGVPVGGASCVRASVCAGVLTLCTQTHRVAFNDLGAMWDTREQKWMEWRKERKKRTDRKRLRAAEASVPARPAPLPPGPPPARIRQPPPGRPSDLP